MGALRFIGGNPGRLVRVGAGAALIAAGLRTGGRARVLVGLGAVPLAAGAFDLCLLGPLFGRPLRGAEMRTTP